MHQLISATRVPTFETLCAWMTWILVIAAFQTDYKAASLGKYTKQQKSCCTYQYIFCVLKNVSCWLSNAGPLFGFTGSIKLLCSFSRPNSPTVSQFTLHINILIKKQPVRNICFLSRLGRLVGKVQTKKENTGFIFLQTQTKADTIMQKIVFSLSQLDRL